MRPVAGSTPDSRLPPHRPICMVHARQATVPIDAVLYGVANGNGLLDESGAAGMVDVGDAPSANSVRLQGDGTWAINPMPAPLDCLPFP